MKTTNNLTSSKNFQTKNTITQTQPNKNYNIPEN